MNEIDFKWLTEPLAVILTGKGVFIAYTSVYGNTKKAVMKLRDMLIERGCPSLMLVNIKKSIFLIFNPLIFLTSQATLWVSFKTLTLEVISKVRQILTEKRLLMR